jgi:hypothetical protein
MGSGISKQTTGRSDSLTPQPGKRPAPHSRCVPNPSLGSTTKNLDVMNQHRSSPQDPHNSSSGSHPSHNPQRPTPKQVRKRAQAVPDARKVPTEAKRHAQPPGSGTDANVQRKGSAKLAQRTRSVAEVKERRKDKTKRFKKKPDVPHNQPERTLPGKTLKAIEQTNKANKLAQGGGLVAKVKDRRKDKTKRFKKK